MRDDCLMLFASCTKLMTTIAAMQRVEKGLFIHDEDVSHILPEWKSLDILTGFAEKTGSLIYDGYISNLVASLLAQHNLQGIDCVPTVDRPSDKHLWDVCFPVSASRRRAA